MNVPDNEVERRSDENTYIDPDSPPPTYLTPSSPSYQILQEQGSRYGPSGRRLSRAQEMAMVERKGERRVSGGLRVEGGGLVKIKLDELVTAAIGRAQDDTDKENEDYETIPRRGAESVIQTPCPVTARTKQPNALDLQKLASRMDSRKDLEVQDFDGFLPETPAPKRKVSEIIETGQHKNHQHTEGETDLLRSPESPATMTCFEPTLSTSGIDPDGINPKTDHDLLTPRPAQPYKTDITPTAAPTTATIVPDAPRKPPTRARRSSSISTFLETLKRTYTSTTSSLAATWVAVGHGSGIPERQVVRRGKLNDDARKRNDRKNAQGQEGGWGIGPVFDSESARKSWEVSGVSSSENEQSEDQHDNQGYEDPREVLAGIANENALKLEADAESHREKVDDESRKSGLGLSFGPPIECREPQDSRKSFTTNGDDDTPVAEQKDVPLKLLESLSITDKTHLPPVVIELPPTAPSRKTIDYRHVVHLLANALGEPRPERVIHHPALGKMIAVAQVDFNHAVVSIMIEATQGPLHQEHYTLHDLYSWYKKTFKRKRAEADTLQALILAMVQVATGRDLGEREELTLQGLQGRPTVLCAVPLGYCLVHADPLRGQPIQALERELEQELTQGRDLVTQDTLDSLDSDGSDTSEEPSGRNIPLTPPATPKRWIDKGKARAIDADEEITVQEDPLVPDEAPRRPSSALPISSTQYSIFPRVIGMVSRKLEVTTELALFQPQVCRALTLAGMTCEQFQDVMFEAQDLDQTELDKPWQEREFEHGEGTWRAYRYYEAMTAISPFGQAVYVQQLRPFQRAIIYLMMLCFDWPENEPEEFVDRLQQEYEVIIDHVAFKPPNVLSEAQQFRAQRKSTNIANDEPPYFATWEDWYENSRTHNLQIGSSTKVWQTV